MAPSARMTLDDVVSRLAVANMTSMSALIEEVRHLWIVTEDGNDDRRVINLVAALYNEVLDFEDGQQAEEQAAGRMHDLLITTRLMLRREQSRS